LSEFIRNYRFFGIVSLYIVWILSEFILGYYSYVMIKGNRSAAQEAERLLQYSVQNILKMDLKFF